MKSLFDAAATDDVRARLTQLQPDSPRQWGKMTSAQAVAHCASAMELAVGDQKPPRMFIGRLLGPLVKARVLGNERPMQRNAPTDKRLIVSDDRDLAAERQRLIQLVDRFSSGGPGRCTTHPHTFFGALTPDATCSPVRLKADPTYLTARRSA